MEIHRTYKSEIPPKIIFEEMKDCFYDFFKKNRKMNSSILIKDYFQIRNSLINMLKKVSDRLGFKSQTYFLSIYYMDIIITENNEIIIFHNYTSLALACLVIASKYCENDPNVPELPYFIRIYNSIVENKHSIAISDLIYNEVKICKILKYKLHFYTIYDYNSFLFGHGILKLDQLKEIKRDKDLPFSIYAKKILEKIYKKSRSYLDIIMTKKVCLKYSSLLISIYIMQRSVESIIISESKINSDIEKMKIRKKAHKYFKDIMNNFYNLNYESMEEYILMKKEIESYKNRNENNIQNIFESFNSNKNIGKIIDNNNCDSNTHKYLETYSNKLSNENNDYFSDINLQNSVNLDLIQNRFISGKNKLIAQTTKNNVNNGKMLMKNIPNNDFNSSLNKIKYSNKTNIYASTNLENENGRNNRDKNNIFREKRIHSNNKNSLNNSKHNLNNDKNIMQYNNFTNKLAYSINLEKIKINPLNRSKDILRPKSNSPKDIDYFSQDKLYMNKKNISKKFMNSNIINKSELNETKNNEFLKAYEKISSPKLNLINELDKTNEKQLMNNINKLYFKKILYNGGSKALPKSKNKNINRKNTNSKKLNDIINRTNYNLKINLNKQFGIVDISEIKAHENKEDQINCNLNNRYGNIFLLSGNNSDNEEKEEGNNKTNNNTNFNFRVDKNSSIGENYIENKTKIKNRKDFSIKNRNISENRNKLFNTSNQESKLLRISGINNSIGNMYFESVEKNKNNPKIKKYNLYSDNNNIKFKSKRDYYINTDINESQCFSSIKTKILRAKSKELESKKTSKPNYKKISNQSKHSENKINILNGKQNNFEIKYNNQEYNIIKFLGNDLINNINNKKYLSNSNTNANKNKKCIKSSKSNMKNKNKLIINDNINNNFNKFDNEIISFNQNRNLKKSLNLNSTDSLDIIVKKRNYKKNKSKNIDHIEKNNKMIIDKNISLTSSNYQKAIKKTSNNNFDNNVIYPTIVINNNININLNKKKRSKDNNKYNFKMNYDNNTFNGLHRNNDNSMLKRPINYKTTERLSNKNLKRIKNN